MAVTTSTRLGLTRWSAGTDPFGRTQLDGDHQKLDDLVAIDKTGTAAARPAFGIRGQYYYATDTSVLYRDTGTAWVAVNTDDIEVFASEGSLSVKQGKGRFRWPFAVQVLGVAATVNTPPNGAAAIIDVNRAAAASLGTLTTIYTTQANRPSIAAAAYASTETVPDVTAFAAGDHMTVDIDQVGSTTAGADLLVHVRYRRT